MSHRINITDWERIMAQYSALYQTIHNGMARMSYVDRAVDFSAPYYFGLDVPEGRELFVFNRELRVANGDYNIDVVIPSDGFTGGTESYISRLRAGATNTIQSKLYAGVTPAGTLTIADVDYVDTGTDPSDKRIGGAPAVEGVMVSVKGKSLLRVTRLDGGGVKAGIRLLVWEDDT